MIHKITSVQNTGTYEGSYGTMYKQEVTLDDNTVGEVSAKTQGKWKVGDTVEVQRTETQYGTRFRFSIPKEDGAPGAPSSGKYQQDPETQSRIEASWAIGQAVTMGAKSHEELVAYGLKLLDARNALIAEIKAQPAAPVSNPLY
jgi:hypothetical protein